ncbi:MAG TPA: hypothetical protein O0X28_00345, partial [Methanocorpusculum sp.]|nr:hypothetical protein [Methanocorpusculum sp.]
PQNCTDVLIMQRDYPTAATPSLWQFFIKKILNAHTKSKRDLPFHRPHSNMQSLKGVGFPG